MPFDPALPVLGNHPIETFVSEYEDNYTKKSTVALSAIRKEKQKGRTHISSNRDMVK